MFRIELFISPLKPDWNIAFLNVPMPTPSSSCSDQKFESYFYSPVSFMPISKLSANCSDSTFKMYPESSYISPPPMLATWSILLILPACFILIASSLVYKFPPCLALVYFQLCYHSDSVKINAEHSAFSLRTFKWTFYCRVKAKAFL